ncbi:hypothetical protein COU20_03375 [Candidatus Kaiserbacteria bacterium CG10_big_fil_rev_8_21_14_0_10_59_10]|uniref:Uncharacterized protein n=1 Tax=Candidatus Kaiserbacteria bacterium CG10_big_fil_rev_8_21_14_0_10_59_10 TaxID=1974612 RepID=A0A2H0U8Q6_9BACT|nr:MAG: hypothetical protein COU20_03375 [Candidatus Kaiserbacteria bacterium CG10_big_fil_rev_8_21_14_0_10_59_10]
MTIHLNKLQYSEKAMRCIFRMLSKDLCVPAPRIVQELHSRGIPARSDQIYALGKRDALLETLRRRLEQRMPLADPMPPARKTEYALTEAQLCDLAELLRKINGLETAYCIMRKDGRLRIGLKKFKEELRQRFPGPDVRVKLLEKY